MRNFINNERFAILLANFCPHANPSTTQSCVVLAKICHPAIWKIGKNIWSFSSKDGNGRIDKFIKIMRKHFTGQTYCNTFGTLRQEKRKFHRKVKRLLITTVV